MAGKNVKGNAIKLNHTIYKRGIGTYANSMLHINLYKGALKFNAIVGFDDEVLGQGCHPIEFIVYGFRARHFDIVHTFSHADSENLYKHFLVQNLIKKK